MEDLHRQSNDTVNPADCASRGMLPRELLTHTLWLTGPDMNKLREDQNLTLDDDQKKVIDDSVKKNSLVLHIKRTPSFPLLTNFSKHSRSIKRVGTITEFVKRLLNKLLRTPTNYEERFLQVSKNFGDAETVIFKILQKEFYYDEIHCLQSSKELNKGSRFLYPFLDGNGILRVGGRL